jgi:predicted Zn-dependent peptidase
MQSSLLFANIRERLGLCYHIGSSLEPSKWILAVYCGINPSCRRLAEGEIIKLFEDIQSGELEGDVLKLAKNSLENYLRQLPDSAGAMEGFYLARALEGGIREKQTPKDFLNMIMQVTVADVVRAAQGFALDMVYFLNATNVDEGESC